MQSRKPSRKRGQVRIISGLWRGRLINFSPRLNVRPTSDRLRETLFNWLASKVRGAWCLDLFAGTGALGFEALSRGARKLTCIDNSQDVITHLKKTALYFNRTDIEIIKGDIPNTKMNFRSPFDIVFIDPPFYRNLVENSIKWLEKENILNHGANIYIEHEKNATISSIPSNWHLIKQSTAGQVHCQLFQHIL